MKHKNKTNKHYVERNKKNTDRKCRQEVILGRREKNMDKRKTGGKVEAELEKERVGMKGSKREKGITLAIIR